jgi:hypothetical protein
MRVGAYDTMTAQFPDTFVLDGRTFALVGVKGSGLFDPAGHGMHPVGTCTACWRGYVCRYGLRDGRLVLDQLQAELGHFEDNTFRPEPGSILNGVAPIVASDPHVLFNNIYPDLALAIPFTGRLLIADDFIQSLYVHMGFHPAWKYRTVLELAFEAGQELDVHDMSAQMEALRNEHAGAPLHPAAGDSGADDWINQSFKLDHDW